MSKWKRAADMALGLFLVGLVVGASGAIDLTSAWGLSSDGVDRKILVAVALAAVTIKVVGGVKAAALYRDGRFGPMIACLGLLGIALSVSVLMESRFYLRVFHDSAEQRQTTASERRALKNDLAAIDARLEQGGSLTSKAELEARILSEMGRVAAGDPQRRTVGVVTGHCFSSAAPNFGNLCAETLTLRAKIAELETMVTLPSRRAEAQQKLKELPPISGGDALADAAERITGVKGEHVLAGVAGLIMLLIQIGSVSLPVIFFGGAPPSALAGLGQAAGREAAGDEAHRPFSLARASPNGGPPGNTEFPLPTEPDDESLVRLFVRDSLVQRPGERVPSRLIFEVFRDLTGCCDIAQRAFGRRLGEALAHAGLPVVRGRFGSVGHSAYQDLALVGAAAEIAARLAKADVPAHKMRVRRLRLVVSNDWASASTAV